jgi:hypothetical protein
LRRYATEMREEDEALMRAVSAVESLMMGGGSDSEVERAMQKGGLPSAASGTAKAKAGLCRLNQVDPYPITYSLSNP